MISIEVCRKTLEKVNGKKYTDEQLIKIREQLYQIADIQINHCLIKPEDFEKHNYIHKSFNRRTS